MTVKVAVGVVVATGMNVADANAVAAIVSVVDVAIYCSHLNKANTWMKVMVHLDNLPVWNYRKADRNVIDSCLMLVERSLDDCCENYPPKNCHHKIEHWVNLIASQADR